MRLDALHFPNRAINLPHIFGSGHYRHFFGYRGEMLLVEKQLFRIQIQLFAVPADKKRGFPLAVRQMRLLRDMAVERINVEVNLCIIMLFQIADNLQLRWRKGIKPSENQPFERQMTGIFRDMLGAVAVDHPFVSLTPIFQ